jgi:hypothetical protein
MLQTMVRIWKLNVDCYAIPIITNTFVRRVILLGFRHYLPSYQNFLVATLKSQNLH